MAPSAARPELNFGSKIILPPSALDKVSRLHVQWPLLMEMINGDKDKHTHCGVLEFIAEEGRAYIPQWVGFVACCSPERSPAMAYDGLRIPILY